MSGEACPALGIRIGHEVFDQDWAIPEKGLVPIGEHASSNPTLS